MISASSDAHGSFVTPQNDRIRADEADELEKKTTISTRPERARSHLDEAENPSEDAGTATMTRGKTIMISDEYDAEFYSDSDVEYRAAPRISEDQITHWARFGDSQRLFSLYKTRLEDKANRSKKRSNQAADLVEGLVDYLRVLENRIKRVEAGTSADTRSDNHVDDTKEDHVTQNDSEIELTVKFFNSAAYLRDDGSYPKLSTEPENGTFMCGRDTQQLIRVLYSRINSDNGAKPQRQADSKPPRAANIDILTIGITSDAICSFFADEMLDLEYDNVQLIRFGKPFRPIIRNIDRLRKQLKKLEDTYERGTIRYESTSRTAGRSIGLAEQPDMTSSHENVEARPSMPPRSKREDDVEAFDRPIALDHFRSLMSFIDEHLGHQVKLYESLCAGKEQHVAFENLWMLFDIHDTIYCPLREARMALSPAPTFRFSQPRSSSTVRVDGRPAFREDAMQNSAHLVKQAPQAYRVVATTGGLPLATAMTPGANPREDAGISSDSYMEAGAETANTVADFLEQAFKMAKNIRKDYTNFNVYCIYIDFDGVRYGMVQDVFTFTPYEREMEIRSLQAYPQRYVLDDRVHHRGTAFLDATRTSHLQHEGLSLGSNREEVNSPVMVDMSLAYEGRPDRRKASIEVPRFRPLSHLWNNRAPSETRDIFSASKCSTKWCYHRDCTDDVYLGYQLEQRDQIESDIKLVLEQCDNERKRGAEGLTRIKKLMEKANLITLLQGQYRGSLLGLGNGLAQLHPVEHNHGWDKLVLPHGHREMVQAMVNSYTQRPCADKRANVGMDFVQGKGSGCIILLHGVPGVGKTSTAECVAAHTKKPLYPMTCGDIGFTTEDVEKNMENHFRLAHKWGCVLLLDEADVFLAKRNQTDIQRNGLVSVFLRILEYYSGILFLTTNRVGTIDDAFRSRLHLTLYYPKLNRKQTKEVFKRNFERIAEVNVDRKMNNLPLFQYTKEEQKIMEWANDTFKTLRWNGRQIRNAFQTALSLAEFQIDSASKPTNLAVTRKHFRIVANASIQFNEYLMETHGQNEDRTAKRDFIRAMEYKPSSGLAFKGFDQTSSDSSSERESRQSEASGDESDLGSSDASAATRKKKKWKGRAAKGSKSSRKKGSHSSE